MATSFIRQAPWDLAANNGRMGLDILAAPLSEALMRLVAGGEGLRAPTRRLRVITIAPGDESTRMPQR